MRVIAGEFRSRILKAPEGLVTRPTPERLRESMFSVIAPRLEGEVFVDAYAGSGSVGIEAISRGASRAYFLEKSKPALTALRENLKKLEIRDRAVVIPGDAAAKLAKIEALFYFLDPPYGQPEEIAKAMAAIDKVAPVNALVIVQHPTSHPPDCDYPGFEQTRLLPQGDNTLSFFHRPKGFEQERLGWPPPSWPPR